MLEDELERLHDLRQLEGEQREEHDHEDGEDDLLARFRGVAGGRPAAADVCLDNGHQGVPPAALAVTEVESASGVGVAVGAAAPAEPLYVKTLRWIVAASCGS